MSQYPHQWDELPLEELTETTEIYTQRKSSTSPPANFRILLGKLRDWLKTQLAKLYFNADGPEGNAKYEFTLGGNFYWHGEKGLKSRLDGNHIFIGPELIDPVDGQVWTYDMSSDQMVLRTIDGEKHGRILISSATTVWNISHNLGWVPNITLRDESGNELHGLQETIDSNTERVTFAIARSGYIDWT